MMYGFIIIIVLTAATTAYRWYWSPLGGCRTRIFRSRFVCKRIGCWLGAEMASVLVNTGHHSHWPDDLHAIIGHFIQRLPLAMHWSSTHSNIFQHWSIGNCVSVCALTLFVHSVVFVKVQLWNLFLCCVVLYKWERVDGRRSVHIWSDCNRL